MGMTARLVALLLAATMLAACSTSGFWGKKDDEDTVDPNAVPTAYKQEILDTLSRSLVDPTNVRAAFVSDPALRQVGTSQRYTVCVRFDARNAARQYEGSKAQIGYFYGGHLNQLIEATPEQCGKADYKPFPELEKLCLATKCA